MSCLDIHYNLKKYDIVTIAICLSNDFLNLSMWISTCFCKDITINMVVLKVLVCKVQILLSNVIFWDIGDEKFGGDHCFSSYLQCLVVSLESWHMQSLKPMRCQKECSFLI